MLLSIWELAILPMVTMSIPYPSYSCHTEVPLVISVIIVTVPELVRTNRSQRIQDVNGSAAHDDVIASQSNWWLHPNESDGEREAPIRRPSEGLAGLEEKGLGIRKCRIIITVSR